MKKAVIVIGILVLVGIGGWFLFSGDNSLPSNPRADQANTAPAPIEMSSTSPSAVSVPAETSSSANPSAVPAIPAEKEFTVEGKNFSFTPSTISVKQGDQVKIVFKNVDGTHDLRIDELNVATKRISAGEEDTVEFIADRVGSFEYYCSVGSHRAMGMKGTLIVQ